MSKLIYVNGDSYSADINKFECYATHLGRAFNIPLVNSATPGSSNDRIFRKTISDLARLRENNSDILAIIGFSFVQRIEVYVDDVKSHTQMPEYLGQTEGGGGFVTKHPGDLAVRDAWLVHPNHLMAHFYTRVHMLTKVLESMGCKYLMFSAAYNINWAEYDSELVETEYSANECIKNPNIINFHEFCIPGWAKDMGIGTTDTGHLLSDGHQKFAEFLEPTVRRITNWQ